MHTPKGQIIITNFCRKICGCSGSWNMESFIESAIREIRDKVKGEKVILGLSGGVDSSVAAALIHKAIGDQLTCIFVNNGGLRKGEPERVKALFGGSFKMPLKYVDAEARFLENSKGQVNPNRNARSSGMNSLRCSMRRRPKFPM